MSQSRSRDAQRAQTRQLRAGERDIERELRQLVRQEQKLQLDVKAAAKRGDASTARLLAKQIVNLRAQNTRMMGMQGRIRGVAAQTTTLNSMATTARAMGTATKVMAGANKAMNPQELQGVLKGFEEQSMRMEMAEEMLDDGLDSVLDDDEVDEESDQILSQVLDEMALKTKSDAATVPSRRMPAAPAAARRSPAMSEEDALLARLAELQ